jgi:hypothetical protein
MKKQVIEKPILFTDQMVNAILKKEKTVTRRLVNPQPPKYFDGKNFVDVDYFRGFNAPCGRYSNFRQYSFASYMQGNNPCAMPIIKAKYWLDLNLWVREAWGVIAYNNNSGYEISVIYRADNSVKNNIDLDNEELFERIVKREKAWEKSPKFAEKRKEADSCAHKNPGQCARKTCAGCERVYYIDPILWRPNILIPRAASRINLKIKDAKIERLHELDDNEARLEGVNDREEYIKLWDSINGKKAAWAVNPWVYKVEFELNAGND